MTHNAPPNGLDPGDRMPGVPSILDEMDELMADWSWRSGQGQTDPGYIYTEAERARWLCHNAVGLQMPAVCPWSFSAYVGPAVKPTRLGVTR